MWGILNDGSWVDLTKAEGLTIASNRLQSIDVSSNINFTSFFFIFLLDFFIAKYKTRTKISKHIAKDTLVFSQTFAESFQRSKLTIKIFPFLYK